MADQTFGPTCLEVVGICTSSSVLKASRFSFAMAARASNSLSKQEYEKIVRANKVSVLKADLSLTLDELASKYSGLLKDLLDKTARVSKTSLCEALVAANEGNDPQDSKHFAGRIVEAVSAGRQMSKSMTTGKKTSVGFKIVAPSRSPESMPVEKNFDNEPLQPRAVPTLPTSSASSSRRLTREEAAKALGLTSGVEETAMGCDLEAASDSPASVHGSSSEESAGKILLVLHFSPPPKPLIGWTQLSQLCVANSQPMLSSWPLCIQVIMVLLLQNSLPLKATVQRKSQQKFPTCCCMRILLARSQPVLTECRSDLQLFLRQTNPKLQKLLQCTLKKVQAQEKKKNLTTLNLQEQLHLLTWATAS